MKQKVKIVDYGASNGTSDIGMPSDDFVYAYYTDEKGREYILMECYSRLVKKLNRQKKMIYKLKKKVEK